MHIFYILVLALLTSCFCLEAIQDSSENRPVRPSQVYYHAAHKKKVPADADGTRYMALTFDDGPHQVLTPRLLDILKEKNAKATFYVMGVKVGIHPDIVTRAAQEGHEIGNHVYDHPVLTKIKPQELDHQISSTNAAIRAATGSNPKTLRPPYGNSNKKVNAEISGKHQMDAVFWSFDTIDWKFPSKEEILQRSLKHIDNGAIVLAHDVHTNTIEAIPHLIDALQKAGFKLLTVSELLDKFHPYTQK
jgi:peptidoglycan/xylan/chitin deacetylase (PgdA/CDA1 family)